MARLRGGLAEPYSQTVHVRIRIKKTGRIRLNIQMQDRSVFLRVGSGSGFSSVGSGSGFLKVGSGSGFSRVGSGLGFSRGGSGSGF